MVPTLSGFCVSFQRFLFSASFLRKSILCGPVPGRGCSTDSIQNQHGKILWGSAVLILLGITCCKLCCRNSLSESSGASHWWAAASTGTSASRTSHGRTSTAVVSFGIARTFIVTAFARTVEEVQLVDEVDHEVRVDGVVPCVFAHHGRDVSADVALLLQDVKALQADGKCLSLEE